MSYVLAGAGRPGRYPGAISVSWPVALGVRRRGLAVSGKPPGHLPPWLMLLVALEDPGVFGGYLRCARDGIAGVRVVGPECHPPSSVGERDRGWAGADVGGYQRRASHVADDTLICRQP